MTGIAPRVADIEEYGTVQRPENFDISWRAFYEMGDERTDRLRTRCRAEVGIMYGDHPFQTLDLYRPQASADSDGRARGLFAFLHGGAFREGHPYHYGFLAEPYLDAGFAFASIGYRLVPDSAFPDTAVDVVAALQWLHRHAASRGYDAGNIVLGGHSAGAMLASVLGVHHDWQAPAGLPADILKGMVLVSGYYDFREEFPGNHIPDQEKRRYGSAICGIDPRQLPPPSVIGYGPTELNWKLQIHGHYAESSDAFADALRAAGALTEVVPLPGANHDDTAAAIADPASPLSEAILRLLSRGLA